MTSWHGLWSLIRTHFTLFLPHLSPPVVAVFPAPQEGHILDVFLKCTDL